MKRVRATPRFDKVSIADRRWFDRHPDRSYRLRFVAEAELQTFDADGSPFPPARSGSRWWVAIRQVRRGHRLKVYYESDRQIDLDEGEAAARVSYERAIASNADARRLEPMLVWAVGEAT